MVLRIQQVTGFLIALLVSGCASLGGTFSVDRFLYMDISGDTAGACMARSYQAWARHKAWVQVNYADAAGLALRAEDAKTMRDGAAHLCIGPEEASHRLRMSRYMMIAQSDPARACSCGNALVELDRVSCAGPGEDKAALQRRLETQAAACEGR